MPTQRNTPNHGQRGEERSSLVHESRVLSIANALLFVAFFALFADSLMIMARNKHLTSDAAEVREELAATQRRVDAKVRRARAFMNDSQFRARVVTERLKKLPPGTQIYRFDETPEATGGSAEPAHL